MTRRRLVVVKHFGRSLEEYVQQKPYGQIGPWPSHIRWWILSPWLGRESGSIMKRDKFWTRR
eukprot:5184186-Karenia_brevis.AAC.1